MSAQGRPRSWPQILGLLGRTGVRIYASVRLDTVLTALVASFMPPSLKARLVQQVLRVLLAERVAVSWRRKARQLQVRHRLMRHVEGMSGPHWAKQIVKAVQPSFGALWHGGRAVTRCRRPAHPQTSPHSYRSNPTCTTSHAPFFRTKPQPVGPLPLPNQPPGAQTQGFPGKRWWALPPGAPPRLPMDSRWPRRHLRSRRDSLPCLQRRDPAP